MSSIFAFALAMVARVTGEMAALFAEAISPKRKALGLLPLLPRKTRRHPRERGQKLEPHFLPQRSAERIPRQWPRGTRRGAKLTRRCERSCLLQIPGAHQREASVRYSSALKRSGADARLSSRCPIEEVPGIGRMAGERCSSQASAIWLGVAPSLRTSGESGLARLPAASGYQEIKAIPAPAHISISRSDDLSSELMMHSVR
jgi:hypothetical protein